MDRSLWEPLLKFESRDFLTRFYKEQHDRTLNAQRAHEIGSCFAQGREYFASAVDASDTVKPLLLYYGVASLARGATLLKNSHKREESLTAGHGLKTIEWAKTLSGGISNILNLGIEGTSGTFSEFVEALGNGQSYAWRYTDGRTGHFKNDFGELRFLSDSSRMSLGDLLSRERDLAAEYEIANDGWGNTDFGFVVASDHALKVMFMPIGASDLNTVIESYSFPEIAKISAETLRFLPIIQMLAVEIPAVGEDQKRFAPLASDQESNVGRLVRPFSNGDQIIDLHRIFLESYVLGMLCRYFPSRWMSLLRSDKGDIARSLILAAISRIEAKFPALLRDQLH